MLNTKFDLCSLLKSEVHPEIVNEHAHKIHMLDWFKCSQHDASMLTILYTWLVCIMPCGMLFTMHVWYTWCHVVYWWFAMYVWYVEYHVVCYLPCMFDMHDILWYANYLPCLFAMHDAMWYTDSQLLLTSWCLCMITTYLVRNRDNLGTFWLHTH